MAGKKRPSPEVPLWVCRSTQCCSSAHFGNHSQRVLWMWNLAYSFTGNSWPNKYTIFFLFRIAYFCYEQTELRQIFMSKHFLWEIELVLIDSFFFNFTRSQDRMLCRCLLYSHLHSHTHSFSCHFRFEILYLKNRSRANSPNVFMWWFYASLLVYIIPYIIPYILICSFRDLHVRALFFWPACSWLAVKKRKIFPSFLLFALLMYLVEKQKHHHIHPTDCVIERVNIPEG